jgi:NAD(P)H-hydrate epimerase
MMTAIPWHRDDLPYLTVPQMIEVDRAMVEDFGIDLVRMMENAGRALAHLGRIRFFEGDPRGRKAVVLAGTGGNGGGALVCALRLHAWGADARVFLALSPGEFTPVPAQQLEILRRMEVPFADGLPPAGTARPDLVVDGVIGYSLKGPPGGTAAGLIRWANGRDAPILALDVPSGFDAAVGAPLEPAVRATATLTLALPKEGLRAPGAEKYVGELYLADIGVPPSLYGGTALGLSVGPLFAESDLLRLR